MRIFISLFAILFAGSLFAQITDPKATEVWQPEPRVVTPGETAANAPSDAIVLFDGKNTVEWYMAKDSSACKWSVDADGAMTVKPRAGAIQTRRSFGDCQIHLEWRTPSVVKGEGQGRGNSGVFLQSRYEVQVLDSYNNRTYSNGQAGSLYKQALPLVNACRPPGTWQTYDILYTAPRFNADGMLVAPARVTVIQNGILVQNHTAISGSTEYIGLPVYKAHGDAPLQLQDHGDLVSYRNIWVRKL
jgi:Domain of Unknown Function (DUF1080)